MKYQNANNLLPPTLVREIQRYIQGGYLYIPKTDGDGSETASETDYKVELAKRNEHIYIKYLEGWSVKRLALRYSLSESSIRRILFSQRKEAHSMYEDIYGVLTNWDIAPDPVVQSHASVWEVGGSYMLKNYSDIPSLLRNAEILSRLRKAGIPAAEVIPTKENGIFAKMGDHACLLTRKLDGKHYSGSITPEFSYQVGTILARLHMAFQTLEGNIQPWDNSLLGEMSGWIRSKLEENQWQVVPLPIFEEVFSSLSACYDSLPVQMIHRDVHLGNFLFSGEGFSGYIDFDLSQRNIRIFDLCYYLAGLLARESAADLAAPWGQIVKATITGYETLLPLSPEEKAAIPIVMQSIEILFAAYFVSVQDLACAADAVEVLYRIRGEQLKLD